jgi:hypothetical protein
MKQKESNGRGRKGKNTLPFYKVKYEDGPSFLKTIIKYIYSTPLL